MTLSVVVENVSRGVEPSQISPGQACFGCPCPAIGGLWRKSRATLKPHPPVFQPQK
jgi:hypothetical protein